MTFVEAMTVLRRFAGSTTNLGVAFLAALIFSGPEPEIKIVWFGKTLNLGWYAVSAACALAGIGRAKAKGPLWPAHKETAE